VVVIDCKLPSIVGEAFWVMILPFPTPDKVAPLNNIKVLSVIAFQINIPAVSPALVLVKDLYQNY